MTIVDVRLPDNVERGALGGPGFNTTVLVLSSGHEKRNQNWSMQRGSWDIGYGIESKDDLTTVITFFHARVGRLFGFRFKDWSDFEIKTEQSIGTGDAAKTVFQIFKRYTSGAINFDRDITKLVSGTTKVFLNSVEQVSGFTLNLVLGTVTFSVAPGAGVDVGVTCEFDVPVRFDTDKLDISMETFNAGSIPQIPIIELRE